MAGIGFELKKLFKGKSILLNLRAYLFSAIVTVGPMLLCITTVTLLQLILAKMGVEFSQRELFLAAVVYSFMFSLIITSGFSMLLSRFVSDKLYLKQYDEILPSLHGAVTICLFLGGIPGLLFYLRSPIDNIYFKIFAYILFIELMIMWLQAIYLSALKDYLKIVGAFISGMAITCILAFVLIKYFNFSVITELLFSIDIGIFIIIAFQSSFINSYFKTKNNKFFAFLKYFEKYPSLLFISLFYTLGTYVHHFVFWLSNNRVTVGKTYSFYPVYDVPVFYAFLTIIPVLVIFVVSVETSFYGKYKEYYSLITDGGNLSDIKRARKEMVSVLFHEITYIMEIQLFFSIVFLVLGKYLLPRIGLTDMSVDTFGVLVFGCYSSAIMLVVMLLLLYFDDRKGALTVSTIFLSSNIVFTTISLFAGENFFGMGYFVASFISLVAALIRLVYYVKNIDYFTFCSQPIVYKEKKGVFTWLVNKLDN